MGDDAECEFARSVADADLSDGRTDGDAGASPRAFGPGSTPGRRVRAQLRTSDGVRIEAASDPYTGGGADPRGGTEAPGAIVLAHGFSGSVDRPAMRRAARVFSQHGAVITFSFRGHGGSGGHSTVGDLEVLDLAAAVRWARSLGHARVATVGFSMGGSVVVRHGALHRPTPHEGRERPGEREGPEMHEGRTVARPGTEHSSDGRADAAEHSDAVVAVSAAARWYYRGTAPMRRLHWVIQRPAGRLVSRYGLRTRIHPHDWDPVPLSPVAAAPLVAPTPLLVVHGDQDRYFPVDHPRSLAAAGDPDRTELWLIEGFGHAENAAEPELLHRIGSWIGRQWQDPASGPA